MKFELFRVHRLEGFGFQVWAYYLELFLSQYSVSVAMALAWALQPAGKRSRQPTAGII